jgi:hypothetical protein
MSRPTRSETPPLGLGSSAYGGRTIRIAAPSWLTFRLVCLTLAASAGLGLSVLGAVVLPAAATGDRTSVE